MADTRRQNVGGKVPVATPNIGPSGTVSMEAALSAAIGAKIRLQTISPASRALDGILFTVSPLLNLLTISITPSTAHPPSTTTSSSPSYHIIPLTSIQTFTILSFPTPPLTNLNHPLPPLDTTALQSRLDTTVAQLQAKEARKGKNVTREAQEIFDRLSRTLPTRWDGERIVVSDAVVIETPYRPEDCRQGAGTPKESLIRVKKVLENERKKLAEKATGAGNNRPAVVPAAVPVGGPRKGG